MQHKNKKFHVEFDQKQDNNSTYTDTHPTPPTKKTKTFSMCYIYPKL